MKEIHEQFFIFNGEVKEAAEFNRSIITQNESVYEVIRVLAGVPLFLEEHLNRLVESCSLLGSAFTFNKDTLIDDIKKLININKNPYKNFKIVVTDIKNSESNILLFFIESNYPSEANYNNGVNAILYRAERANPNAKVIRPNFRETIKESLKKNNAYEALLVNESKEITEGSRSNIFLVKDNVLYTSPAKDVLKGVTRKRIIDLCNRLNIEVVEKPIPVEFLYKSEGLFMTGTSPKVLPITKVDNAFFSSSSHPLIVRVMKEYDALINKYIKEHSLK